MRNFPVEHEGNTYWVSPSLGTGVFVFAQDSKYRWCILATKRGSGAKDWNGCWAIPGGYHEFDEHTYESAKRELKEETGMIYYKGELEELGFRDNISTINHSSTMYYIYIFDPSWKVAHLSQELTTKFCEPDEVEDIQFIPIESIHKYEWAFHHKALIEEVYNKRVNINPFKRLIIHWYNKYCKPNLNL